MVNVFSNVIKKLENPGDIAVSHDEAIKIVEANIRVQLAGKSAKVLLTGTCAPSDICYVAQELRHVSSNTDITYIEGENLFKSHETIEKLAQADYVVLVEKKNNSYLSEVDKQIIEIERAEKKILGLVLLEDK